MMTQATRLVLTLVATWVGALVMVGVHVAPAGCHFNGLILRLLATWTAPGVILLASGLATFVAICRKTHGLWRFMFVLAYTGWVLMASALTVALSLHALADLVVLNHASEIVLACLSDATTNYLNEQAQIFYLLAIISWGSGIATVMINRRGRSS